MNIPQRFDFGGGELVELDYLCEVFGICRRTASKYLKALHIQPMRIRNKRFFSLQTFKRIMFVLSKPGAPGILMPGSTGKNDPRLLKDARYISEVTDEILAEASKPEILLEMGACGGRNPDMIKKLATRPVGRPRKEDKDGA